MFLVATIVAASALALVHVFVGKLRFLSTNSAAWESAATGIGIAYAFLVLLPKLAAAQSALQAAVRFMVTKRTNVTNRPKGCIGSKGDHRRPRRNRLLSGRKRSSQVRFHRPMQFPADDFRFRV